MLSFGNRKKRKMAKNLLWLFQRSLYCFLIAQTFWWKTETKTASVLFWILTVYFALNMLYVQNRLVCLKAKRSYDVLLNACMDIVPAFISVLSVYYWSKPLGVVFAIICFRFFKFSFSCLLRKDYV